MTCPLCGQAGIIADTRGGRWCWRCTAQLLTDVRRLQALEPAALGTLVAMLRDAGAGGDEFDTTPDDGPTRAQLGDLWIIGGVHRLLVGDCTDPANVARLVRAGRGTE